MGRSEDVQGATAHFDIVTGGKGLEGNGLRVDG
jgi:hypothetical protein